MRTQIWRDETVCGDYARWSHLLLCKTRIVKRTAVEQLTAIATIVPASVVDTFPQSFRVVGEDVDRVNSSLGVNANWCVCKRLRRFKPVEITEGKVHVDLSSILLLPIYLSWKH